MTPDTSLGFLVTQFATDVLGIEPLPWQRWLFIHALELQPDGVPRFRTLVVLVARQNGKSTLAQILSLFVMYVLGRRLVIGTAQNLDVAEEVWQGAVELAEETPELAAHVEQVSRVNGKKFLKLDTGERYKVAAASRRGGRGLSGDLVLLDELREHQSWDAWGAVTKTTMARHMAQVWALSNAGDATSIVLRWLRRIAHLAIGDPDGFAADQHVETPEDDDGPRDDSLGVFEWSAVPGCAIMDPGGWVAANPALGHTIDVRAIRSAAATDPEWVFRTEVLCQWVDTTVEGPFPVGSWEACADPTSRIADGSPVMFGVDVSWDRTMAYVAAAGWRDDGAAHVEVVAARVGTDWVVPWFGEREDRSRRPVVVQASGAPATSLIEPLSGAGVTVVEWKGTELGVACGDLYDRVRQALPEQDGGVGAPGVRHLSQPVLDVAAATAATRPVGDAWVWDRKRSPNDAAPLVAATGALWGLVFSDVTLPTAEIF